MSNETGNEIVERNLSSTDTRIEEDDNQPLHIERSPGFFRRRREKARKRLNEALGRVDAAGPFFRMIWAIDRIGVGDRKALSRFPRRRPELVEWAFAPHHIHKWTLESLVNAYLRSKQLRRRDNQAFRTLDTENLGSPINLMKLMSELENADDGVILQRLDVIGEIHRLTQRQFHWQRGKVNKAAFFKAAYLYTFPEAADYFESKFGLSIHDFCFSGFALYVMLREHPAVQMKSRLVDLPIGVEALTKGLTMFARSEDSIRQEAASMPQVTTHAAYQASVLRKWPCISFPSEGVMYGPIPDLVIERCTNGLYYDLVDNDGRLRDLFGKRFESYCSLLLSSLLSGLKVAREFKYGRDNIDSPDLFLTRGDETVAIVECKAKKASIAVKLGEEPDLLESAALDELAKGAFQIWRFRSHVRRGIVKPPGGTFSNDAIGVVVFLDTWMETSHKQHNEVLRRALAMSAAKDIKIEPVDQVPVAFCNVDDLEFVLHRCTDASFLDVFAEAAKPERAGWLLSSLHSEVAPGVDEEKGDPFDPHLGDVIKWWPEKWARSHE
ncbi:hypothetical protein [Pararhizobium sp.]|uniref:hypothetical protein n=1 Tax=Pararhizobium sp. TaxID=1977563 RepID=UPI00272589AC|nr:hypothetical protein [Pararhizobium sp.]MDO9415272.1 hypothetical protein [Pararhizobium sp.]